MDHVFCLHLILNCSLIKKTNYILYRLMVLAIPRLRIASEEQNYWFSLAE